MIKLILRQPSVLYTDTQNRLDILKDFLIGSVGLSKDKARKVLLKHPTIINRKITSMESCLEYFKKEFQVSKTDLAQIFGSHPALLGSSIENKLKLNADFFMKEMGIHPQTLLAMLITKPQLLTYSLEGNLLPKIDLLLSLKGVTKTSLRELIEKNPTILGYSCDGRMVPRLNEIRESGIEPCLEHIQAISMYPKSKFDKYLDRLCQ